MYIKEARHGFFFGVVGKILIAYHPARSRQLWLCRTPGFKASFLPTKIQHYASSPQSTGEAAVTFPSSPLALSTGYLNMDPTRDEFVTEDFRGMLVWYDTP